MTDAEIVKHLAGVMGWKLRQSRAWNPLESRDDCAEAEAEIPEGKRWDYVMELREMVDPEGDRPNARTCTALVYATPRQRCLAMVKATR